jgi:hypothetical protein
VRRDAGAAAEEDKAPEFQTIFNVTKVTAQFIARLLAFVKVKPEAQVGRRVARWIALDLFPSDREAVC